MSQPLPGVVQVVMSVEIGPRDTNKSKTGPTLSKDWGVEHWHEMEVNMCKTNCYEFEHGHLHIRYDQVRRRQGQGQYQINCLSPTISMTSLNFRYSEGLAFKYLATRSAGRRQSPFAIASATDTEGKLA